MRAAQIDRYSKDIDIKIRDIPIPEISDDEVLVNVKAAAVNPLEILILTGSVRLIQDYKMPLTLGNEFSGVVEKIGAFADYAVVDSKFLSYMPNNCNFIEAAAIPLTALTAYQALK